MVPDLLKSLAMRDSPFGNIPFAFIDHKCLMYRAGTEKHPTVYKKHSKTSQCFHFGRSNITIDINSLGAIY